MAGLSFPRDNNFVPVMGGVSTVDGTTPVPIYVDPITKQVQTNAGADLNVLHYSDATYDYYCFAVPGTSASTAAWKIKRVDSNANVTWAGGSSSRNKAATDLTTVQGYSYS